MIITHATNSIDTSRRRLLQGSLATCATFSLLPMRSWAASADARIDILLNEPIAQIQPTLYGQFTEHIGGVIYDGVWVGERSHIANLRGVRKQLVDCMKAIKVPVIRWPGGCFADSYDWHDGIGPADKRPRRTNFWEVDADAARLHEQGPQIIEPNTFGTDEFLRFCHLTGAQPYLAANLRSQPALSFDRWVEYCNAPAGSTTLADMRAANGSREPYRVRYWGVGNESWGCGGNFTPEEYASEFRRFTTWVPQYGVDLELIGSGPNDNDIDWTHRFFDQILSGPHAYQNRQFTGWSIHHYANGWSRDPVTHEFLRGKALDFGADDFYSLLRECADVETILLDQWAAIGEYDTQHRVKLVVDEYGPWYREGTEVDPTHIFGQQVTQRDALATALTLDVFNRHADKVSLATCAQLVNNINALFLTHEERFLTTPNYHVFALYAPHQGAQSVRAVFQAPANHSMQGGQAAWFWSLNGSASRQGNTVTLTVVNTNLAQPSETQVCLRGASPTGASSMTLATTDVHAHNTFEQADAVVTRALPCRLDNDAIRVTLPPASVTRLTINVS